MMIKVEKIEECVYDKVSYHGYNSVPSKNDLLGTEVYPQL